MNHFQESHILSDTRSKLLRQPLGVHTGSYLRPNHTLLAPIPSPSLVHLSTLGAVVVHAALSVGRRHEELAVTAHAHLVRRGGHPVLQLDVPGVLRLKQRDTLEIWNVYTWSFHFYLENKCRS